MTWAENIITHRVALWLFYIFIYFIFLWGFFISEYTKETLIKIFLCISIQYHQNVLHWYTPSGRKIDC